MSGESSIPKKSAHELIQFLWVRREHPTIQKNGCSIYWVGYHPDMNGRYRLWSGNASLEYAALQSVNYVAVESMSFNDCVTLLNSIITYYKMEKK